MAYHDSNKRELELTKHVSLRQLDPLALLALRATGKCQLTIPEWLYDLDGAGHYMRRIKSVAVSIPSVVGPYVNVSCTVSLLRSTVRISPELHAGHYARDADDPAGDSRFVDRVGAVQTIVTSGAQGDSGMFEANLHDERMLPFEGAGAVSTWRLELPTDYPAFDYDSITDVILHIRYTARPGVDRHAVTDRLATELAGGASATVNQAVLLDLRRDFSSEWARFAAGTAAFTATVLRDCFPYRAQHGGIAVTGIDFYAATSSGDISHRPITGWDTATADLANPALAGFSVTVPRAGTPVLDPSADGAFYLVVRFAYVNAPPSPAEG
jgi:hypothetical protein